MRVQVLEGLLSSGARVTGIGKEALDEEAGDAAGRRGWMAPTQKRKEGGGTDKGGVPWGSSAGAPPGASCVRVCVWRRSGRTRERVIEGRGMRGSSS